VFTAHELRDGLQIASGGVVVEAIAVEHGLETYGLRVSASGNTLAYSADSRSCEALHRLAEGADLFLARSERLPRTLHMTPRQAGEIATGAGVRMLMLTHLPPTGDPARAIELAASLAPSRLPPKVSHSKLGMSLRDETVIPRPPSRKHRAERVGSIGSTGRPRLWCE
jgi:ribonuclease BN (tRNA processing enzyme)